MSKSRFRRTSRGWNKYRKHSGPELIHRHGKKIYDTIKHWSVLYPESIKKYIEEYADKEGLKHLYPQILQSVEKQIEEVAQKAMKNLKISEEERSQTGLKKLVLT